MEIEYKKKHRPLKVKLLDETVRTFLIDESSTVADLTEFVGIKMGIKNPEEFSFQVIDKCVSKSFLWLKIHHINWG